MFKILTCISVLFLVPCPKITQSQIYGSLYAQKQTQIKLDSTVLTWIQLPTGNKFSRLIFSSHGKSGCATSAQFSKYVENLYILAKTWIQKDT